MTVLEDFDLADGVYTATPDWEGMVRHPAGPLVASAIPVKPPGAWFQNPNFSQLMPLTIQSDGRVSGHIASWREDHIGMAGRVKAPRSKSGYAFFATGALETQEGNMVNVGQITLTGGHAPLEASVAEAVAHYDDTDSAIIDVAVGEDRHGIWVAGSLRPTVDDNQMRAIRASSVSGDWRPINGNLEMVAVCAVNVPGFPIPRARVAGGMPLALVAAGTGALVDLMLHSDTIVADEIAASFDDRLRLIENVVLGKVADTREALTAAIESVRQTDDLEARLAALRASVHPKPDVDALRERVHRKAVVASLRDRVHGGGGAVPFADGSLSPLTAAFEETLHPRGKDGKWIELGGLIKLSGLLDNDSQWDNKRGKVTSMKNDRNGKPQIQVKVEDGPTILTTPDHISKAPDKARLNFKPDDVSAMADNELGPNVPGSQEEIWKRQALYRSTGGLDEGGGGTGERTGGQYVAPNLDAPYADEGAAVQVKHPVGSMIQLSGLGDERDGQWAEVVEYPTSGRGKGKVWIRLEDTERAGEYGPLDYYVDPESINPTEGDSPPRLPPKPPPRPGGPITFEEIEGMRTSTSPGDSYVYDSEGIPGKTGRTTKPTKWKKPELLTDEELGYVQFNPWLIYETANPTTSKMMQAYNFAVEDEVRKRAGGSNFAPVGASAALRDVWEDGMPIEYDTAQCLQASLRARVRGGVVATATKSWTADKRKKAAGRGAAMPGGRYPIADCKDVGKAVRAVGRGKGDHGKIRAHIIRRAKSLGCMSNVPDDWK